MGEEAEGEGSTTPIPQRVSVVYLFLEKDKCCEFSWMLAFYAMMLCFLLLMIGGL